MSIDGKFVLHSCDNPPCVNPAHLRPGTPAENVADMHGRGRGNIGSVNGQAKLAEAQVAEILRKYREGAMAAHILASLGAGEVSPIA